MKDSLNLIELNQHMSFTAHLVILGVQLQDQDIISARFKFKSNHLHKKFA